MSRVFCDIAYDEDEHTRHIGLHRDTGVIVDGALLRVSELAAGRTFLLPHGSRQARGVVSLMKPRRVVISLGNTSEPDGRQSLERIRNALRYDHGEDVVRLEEGE